MTSEKIIPVYLDEVSTDAIPPGVFPPDELHPDAFEMIADRHPMIHAMTNAVTRTDVVNMILASGGSAICSENPEEAAEITALCQGLLINIGMPDERRLEAMILSGREANERKIPVVLDPAGLGASEYRASFVKELLTNIRFDCIRANMSETAALSGMSIASRGVEECGARLTEEQMMELAGRLNAVLAVTGSTDYIVSPEKVLVSKTGSLYLKRITGAGCMLSGIVTAALAAGAMNAPKQEPEQIRKQEIIADAIREYGEAAGRAEAVTKKAGGGIGTFRIAFFDEISRIAKRGFI